MLRTEVKWINGTWRAFKDDRSHFGAGISLICDAVEESMKAKLKDLTGSKVGVAWRVQGNKLIAEPDTSSKKISKSDQ